MASSLAFTPIQGIELHNPGARGADFDARPGTESYFSAASGFRTLTAPGAPPLSGGGAAMPPPPARK
jgi:hypothetical protein